jgi:hypothetical protein
MGSGWSGTAPPGFVRRVAGRAGIAKRFGPRTLRHAFIPASFDAGSRYGMSRKPPRMPTRTTMRYDRTRGGLDRHATYAYLAGAVR